MDISKLLTALLLLSFCVVYAESDIPEDFPEDPNYKPLEDQCLLFPMMRSDFKNWNSMGSAVFLTNKAVLAPETKNTKGLIHSKKPNSSKENWIVDVNLAIGREKVTDQLRAGDGVGIYYLKYIDEDDLDSNQNFFGYKDDFDGYGIFINTLSSQPDRKTKAKLVNISGFSNDGKKVKS